MSERVLTVGPDDVLAIEAGANALMRSGDLETAKRLWVLALRGRYQGKSFRCDVDESAGMAEIVELHQWSKKAPCA